MIKAVLFFVIGAGAAYLYMNPGDVDGMLEMGKQGIHNGALVIQEATKEQKMFHQYSVYYDGKFQGNVMALSEHSALDKGCQLVGVSASAYTGKARRLVEVVRR